MWQTLPAFPYSWDIQPEPVADGSRWPNTQLPGLLGGIPLRIKFYIGSQIPQWD